LNISVIIPSYNRYEFLKRALTSIFSQKYLPNEVIVIDDGSTDNTLEIETFVLKTFISVIPNSIGNLAPQFRYIYQENRGVSSARNLGIKNATCDWIAFLDSDDEFHIDKLKEQAEFHSENPDILMSYTNEMWMRDGVEVKVPKKFRKFGGEIFQECLSHCIIAPSATLIHKKLLNEVGLFDESLEVCEDYDLWLRVSQNHKIGLIDKKLITKYAGHDDQLSFKYWGMDRFRVLALEKLLESMDEIPSWHALWVQAENDGVVEVLDTHSPSFRAKTRNLVIDVLLKKYKLLLKGAIKYDRIADIKIYEKRLRELNE